MTRTTEIPLELKRAAAPVDLCAAVYVPTASGERILEVCSVLRTSPKDRVFTLAMGVLIKLERNQLEAPVGTIGLRALAEDFLIPIDAELAPSLLPDETKGVSRDRGLVMLPGGTVLGYRIDAPTPLDSLISAPRRPDRGWMSLPEVERIADRINAVYYDPPSESTFDVDSGTGPNDSKEDEGAGSSTASGVGAEPLENAPTGRVRELAGGASALVGGAMANIGAGLGMDWLANLGKNLLNKGLRLAPKVTEELVGKQRAALERLLEDFRNGDVEKALRRAQALVRPESRGALRFMRATGSPAIPWSTRSRA